MKYVGLIFRLHVSKYMNKPFSTIFDLNNDLLQVLLVILVVLSSEKNCIIFFLLKLKKVAAELEKSVVKIHLEEYTTKENVKNHHEFKKMHKNVKITMIIFMSFIG